jgi:hypothetical protein
VRLIKEVLLGDSFSFDRTADRISRNGKPLGSFASLRSVQVREKAITGKNRLSFVLGSDEWIVDNEGVDFDEYLRAGTELAKIANVELERYDPTKARPANVALKLRTRPYNEQPLLVGALLLMGGGFLLWIFLYEMGSRDSWSDYLPLALALLLVSAGLGGVVSGIAALSVHRASVEGSD